MSEISDRSEGESSKLAPESIAAAEQRLTGIDRPQAPEQGFEAGRPEDRNDATRGLRREAAGKKPISDDDIYNADKRLRRL